MKTRTYNNLPFKSAERFSDGFLSVSDACSVVCELAVTNAQLILTRAVVLFFQIFRRKETKKN